LQTLYNQHSYALNHVWNSDEIGIQVPKDIGVKVLLKRRSNVVYNTIPKAMDKNTQPSQIYTTKLVNDQKTTQ
jgi:hypothetical protein